MRKKERMVIREALLQLVEGEWERPMKALCDLSGMIYPAVLTQLHLIQISDLLKIEGSVEPDGVAHGGVKWTGEKTGK